MHMVAPMLIVQWLTGMRTSTLSPSLDRLDSTFTLTGMAACLLDRVCAERLEGCTALHCAAISGDAAMVWTIYMLAYQSGVGHCQCLGRH